MTLNEAQALAQQQADEFGFAMIVVRDGLSEDAGGYECCAEIYRETLYPDHHSAFWEIVGRVRAEASPRQRLITTARTSGFQDSYGGVWPC
jgi:hypothetical protein